MFGQSGGLVCKVNSLIVWHYHATLSSGSRPHNQKLWESGALRCVLIATKNPETFTVHVFHGDSPVCMERCENADDAAVVAERLRQFLAERDPCPRCKSQRLTRVGLVTGISSPPT
jgi:hypothetical protein